MRVCRIALLAFLTTVPALAKAKDAVTIPLTNSQGQDAGTATFKPVHGGKVEVKLKLKNLPMGEHGVHIHQNAKCDAPDFKSSGGHFNPDAKQHGYQNPAGHHNGDLPQNVVIGEGHVGEATFKVDSISMTPGAANSIFANGGTSIMVHEKADDMKTDPSGNSGNRIACGVIAAPTAP